MQATVTYNVADMATFKNQLLSWANQFNSCCFLDNHLYHSPWQQQECMVAAGSKALVRANGAQSLAILEKFLTAQAGQWVFGHLGFGLQAEIESVPNVHVSESGFSDLEFFVPAYLILLRHNSVNITADTVAESDNAFEQITMTEVAMPPVHLPIVTKPLLSQHQYLSVIEKLRQHIGRGDCYEINFCQEFIADHAELDALHMYRQLSQISPNPFSCYYKQDHSILACASPERFLLKKADKIISQPIKGTASRNTLVADHDAALKTALQHSEKDRQENVMVVDLVRNDLSKVCRQGTVSVEELFGVYTYPQVHQMISTVGGLLKPDLKFTDIIRACFPMGSMTGAPKRRVLELIQQYEASARGLFSGSVGYLSPNGDFDFNVVIRSLVYNELSKRLSFHVGSGITWGSKPELEYEECKWKASAMEQVLQG